MSLDVCIFDRCVSSGGRVAFKALSDGLRASGESVRHSQVLSDCDVAVHASGVKGGPLRKSPLSRAREELIEFMPERRLIVESPVFRQGRTEGEFWRLSWNGFLRTDADYCNDNMPHDRWDMIRERQKIHLLEHAPDGEVVVVMMQKPSDASINDLPHIDDWTQGVIVRLTQYTDRDIIVRQHPLDKTGAPRIVTFTGAEMSTRSLAADLDRAHAIVTHTSLVAIEAICAGVPVFATSGGSLAWDMANHDLADIEYPEFPSDADRAQWLADLAYTQWTVDELRDGTAWRHLKPRYF